MQTLIKKELSNHVIKPAQKNYESYEQRELIKWASHYPIPRDYLIAIPNGGFRNKREARNLKLQGVKAGVSDLLLAYPIKPYSGLWIELKRRSKYIVSKSQNDFIGLMRKAGYKAEIACGWEEAAKLIQDYLATHHQKSKSQLARCF